MHALDPARHGLKGGASALLAVLLALAGPAIAAKKDDTLRFA